MIQQSDHNEKAISRKKISPGFKLFLMVLPFLILVFMFSYLPLYGWVYAFFDYKPPLKLSQSTFVGLEWFKFLFQNPTQLTELLRVLSNTLAMSGLGILISLLSMIFAVFLTEVKSKRYKKFVQVLTTLPNFISWVLVYSVAFALFSNSGMMNNVLQSIGAISQPIKFMDSDTHTWLSMFLWAVWKGLGWGAIMYLATISSLDQELYEAARVDGAGRFKLMWHITLPGLIPTFFVLLMLSVANFLSNGLDQYYVFHNAFNMQHIQVLDLYVYVLGLGNGSYSLATALSMMKSIVSIILLAVVNILSKVVRGESMV